MKKFLSMALALVMTLSLCTFVTSGASAKDFTDDSDIQYKEAVDVISVLNVMDGTSEGAFNPKGGLTRRAAAKIICNLILGPTTAAALPTNANPFPDVIAGDQFAGYIAYCADHGIISGYADKTFKPADPLSGYAFMKMLLGALGYDAELEGFVGANWRVNVAKLALGIGLDDDMNGQLDGTMGVDRETAALLCFNMIQKDLVEYDSKTTVSVNGATVTVGGNTAKVRTWATSSTDASRNYISDATDGGRPIMQFAELYFNKLRKDADETDAFGRPTTKWFWKGEEVGNYPDKIAKTYWGDPKVSDIYKDLGMSSDDNARLIINGIKITDGFDDNDVNAGTVGAADANPVVIKKSSADSLADVVKHYGGDPNATPVLPVIDAAFSGKESRIGDGTQIDVFRDEDENEVTICVVSWYGGKVDSFHKATSSRDAYIDIKAADDPAKRPENVASLSANFTFRKETDDFAEDDIVAYTYDDSGSGSVENVVLLNPIEGNISRYTQSKNMTVSGNTYKYSKMIVFPNTGAPNYMENTNANDLYKVYLYEGLILYVDDGEEEIATDGSKGYAVVLDISGEGDGGMNDNEARILFSDGTRRTVTLTKDYKYETAPKNVATGDVIYFKRNSSNEYSLTHPNVEGTPGVATGNNAYTGVDQDTATFSIDNDREIQGTLRSYKVDNNTVYVTQSGSTYRRYVGYKNAPIVAAGAEGHAYIKEGKIKYMFIVKAGTVTTATKDLTFLIANTASNRINDDETYYYTYTAIVGNQVETVKVSDTATIPVNTAGGGAWISGGTGTAPAADFDKAWNSVIVNIVNKDDDDIITSANYTKNDPSHATRGIKAPSGGDIDVGTNANFAEETLTLAPNVVVWFIDKDDNIVSISPNSIESDSAAWVYYTIDVDDKEINNLFIIETDD